MPSVRHWCKDEQMEYAKQTCLEMLSVANSVFAVDPDKGKQLNSDAIKAHALPRIKAMLELGASEPGMAVTDAELDADPMLLGVQNGVVDLRSGKLLFDQPEMRITKFCHANHDPNASCPRWLKFLDQIFQGDKATIGSVQRLLGYTLTGLCSEEVLVICYGYGSNGKSVFNNVVQRIIGDYSKTAPSSLLVARRSDDSSPRNDLAAMAGARYISINELQAGARLDEQVVKQLAGRELIAARFLHKEWFHFSTTFTAWIRTNHKPIITGEDDGIWRRLVILPFLRQFKNNEKDPTLEEKLMGECDGILMWMLKGTQDYRQIGLRLSPTIRREGAQYRKDSDLLGEFIQDKLTVDPNARIEKSNLFSIWKSWCEVNGCKHGISKTFTQRMAERGYVVVKSNGQRFYAGVRLQSQGGEGGI